LDSPLTALTALMVMAAFIGVYFLALSVTKSRRGGPAGT
jgi:hypothetical protein